MGNELFLKPLFQKHLSKREIIGFDVETIGKHNEFYMGGLYSKEGYKAFYDRYEMIQELQKKEYFGNKYITATNLLFDFTTLYFDTKYWNDFKIILRGSDLITATTKNSNTKQRLQFIDTFNYAKFGVAKMGEIINIPKLESPSCLGREPENKKEAQELETYNERDCEITYKFMNFMQDSFHDLGAKLKLTSASTSMDLFRRKYLRKTIMKEEYTLKQNVNEFIFKAYYGGRTEVFKRGLEKRHLRAYDINSLYPSVMLEAYPRPDSAKITNYPTQEHLEYEGVSHVRIYCPYMEYPLLPVRHDGKLVFPTGVFEGHYTHIELRKALELGYKIIKMYKTLYYTKTFYPFKNYVEDLYSKRLELQAIGSNMQMVVKLFLNSLYGKFGQKTLNDTQIINFDFLEENETEEFLKNTMEKVTRDGKHFIMNQEKTCNQGFVIPIFATYTTARARIKIHHYIQRYNAYYCDTDCAVTRKEMLTSNKLGSMKLEHDIKKAIFVKPKMYMYDIANKDKTIIKLKGVRSLTKDKFMNILRGNSVSFQKFMKLKESVRRAIPVNTVDIVEKNISLEDNKREWLTKFNPNELQNSQPLYLSEKWEKQVADTNNENILCTKVCQL